MKIFYVGGLETKYGKKYSPALLNLHNELYENQSIILKNSVNVDGFPSIKSLREIWSTNTKVAVAVEDDVVLGFISFEARSKIKRFLNINNLYVIAEARGKGVGTQLLEWVINFAKAHGYQYIDLDVLEGNPAAMKLYNRYGFKGEFRSLIKEV